jgi:hypothetical protein
MTYRQIEQPSLGELDLRDVLVCASGAQIFRAQRAEPSRIAASGASFGARRVMAKTRFAAAVTGNVWLQRLRRPGGKVELVEKRIRNHKLSGPRHFFAHLDSLDVMPSAWVTASSQ